MFDFFQRFFPDKKDGKNMDGETIPVNSAGKVLAGKPQVSQTLYRVASCQSTGLERSHNEDTLLTINTLLDGITQGNAFGIFLVADGMGGHQNGEVASGLAAQGVSQFLMDRIFDKTLFEGQAYSSDEALKLLGEAVDEAQTLIRRRVPGGGTTLTVVMALGNDLFSAHVGDSRLYVVGTGGQMTLRTRDHSLVKRLIDLGEITEEEAAYHPRRNVLYRALGQMDVLEVDLDHFTIAAGERLLICSDGLWGVLKEEQMKAILGKPGDLDQAACELVNAANQAGGPDNITVVLVEKLSL